LARFPVVFRIEAPEGPYVVYRTDLAQLGSGWGGVSLGNLAWSDAGCPEAEPAWGISYATGATPLCGGQPCPDSLVVHAPCRVSVDADGYSDFVARVGIDDSQTGCPASARFRVIVDGEERYASPLLRPGAGPWPIWVDLRGGRILELATDDAGDGNRCDHGLWIDPRLLLSRLGARRGP
jgi:hypothetical protein